MAARTRATDMSTAKRWASGFAGFLLVATSLLVVSAGTVAAQSAGCTGGPYAGATTLDSDGDGVNDSDEVIAGTDECDPTSSPTVVCGQYIASYNAASADSDADGHTDAEELAAGSDPCDGTSVIAAATTSTTSTTTTTTAPSAAGVPAAAPRLALTGPSSTVLFALTGVSLILIGVLARTAHRRLDA